MFEAVGDESSALRSFIDAFEIFEKIGYKRRATVAALSLARMTRSNKYKAYALMATEGLASSFWMRREAESATRPENPIVEGLTPLEKETLALVCEGRTNREIATLQDRSYYTVRNMVSDLLETFGVKNRKRLIAMGRERRLAAAPGRSTG